jgi:ribose transport system substrate-binding protein
MGSTFRGRAAMGAALAAMVFAAGCGSDDKSTSTAAAGSADTTTTAAAASSGTGEAAKEVAAYEKTTGVKFPQPTEAFDPGTGKVAVISCGNAGINCLQGAKDVQAAAKAMGWTPSPIFDGEFTPAKQAGFVQQAIQQKYDAIVMVSMDAQSIKAAVDAAVAAKIPIACVMCVNPSFAGKVVDVTSGGIAEGKALGAWIAANAKDGKAKVVAYDDKSFPIVAVRRENMTSELTKLCPGCEIEKADFPTSDLAKAGAPTFTGMLSSHPKGSLDFVAGPYDPASIPFAKAAAQQGRDDFKLTGYDASPDFLKLMTSGSGVAAATTASPFPYASWGAMDEVARLKAGKEAWDASTLPSALVTTENASEFSEGFFSPSDFDFKSMFTKLWGKS